MTSKALCELMEVFKINSVEELKKLNREDVNEILNLEKKRYDWIKEKKLDEPVKPGKPKDKKVNFNYDKLNVDEETYTIIEKSVKDIKEETDDLLGKVNYDDEKLKSKWIEEVPEELDSIINGVKPQVITIKEASEISEKILNNKTNTIKEKLSKILGKNLDINKLDSTLVALRTVMVKYAENIETLATKSSISDKEVDELINLFNDLEVVSFETKNLQRNMGRGVASGNINIKDVNNINSSDYDIISSAKIFGDRTEKDVMEKSISEFKKLVKEIPQPTDKKRKKFLEDLLQSKNMKELLEDLKEGKKKIEEHGHKNKGDISDLGWYKKLIHVGLEAFRTSLLSGTGTQIVNITGTTIALTTKKMENYLMFGLRGFGLKKNSMSFEEVKALNDNQLAKHLTTSFKNLKDSIVNKSFLDAKKMEDQLERSQIDSYQSSEKIANRVVSGKTFGLTGNTEKLVDNIGRLIRTPYQVLGTVDDGFKRSLYLAKIKQLAIRKSYDLPVGTTQKEIEIFKEKFIKMYEDLNVNKIGSKISPEDLKYVKENYDMAVHEDALHYARVNTFTNDIVGDDAISKTLRKLEEIRNDVPEMQFIIPFFKTPVNLVKWSVDRTPGLNLLAKRNRDKLISGNAEERAEVIANMTTGTLLIGGLNYIMFDKENKNINITGSNGWKADRTGKVSGKPPYSIRIGDKWYDYSRLDPIATIIGMTSDLANFHKEMIEHSNGNLPEEYLEDYDKVLELITMTTSNNLMSKTWAKGLSDFIKIFTGDEATTADKLTRYIKQVAVNTIPLGSLAKDLTQEEYSKEAKTFMEMFYAKYRTGLNRPKLDIFGRLKPEERTMSPIKTREAVSRSKDPGLVELARLKIEANVMRPKITPKKGMGFPVELNEQQHWELRRLLDTKYHLVDELNKLARNPKYINAPDGINKEGMKISNTVILNKRAMLEEVFNKIMNEAKQYYFNNNKELQDKWKENEKLYNQSKENRYNNSNNGYSKFFTE